MSCRLSRVLSLQVRSDVEKLEEIKRLPKLPHQEFVEVGERQLRAIWLQCRWEVDKYLQQPETKLFLVVPNSVTRNKPQQNTAWEIQIGHKERFSPGNGICTPYETSVLGGLEDSAQQSWYSWKTSPCTAQGLDCVPLEVPSSNSVFLWIQICFFFIQKNVLSLHFPVLTSFLKSPNWSQ